MWFFALTLGLLACGGDEEAPPAPTPSPPVAPAAKAKAKAAAKAAETEAEAEAADEDEDVVEVPEPEEPEAASDAEKIERGRKLARAGHDDAALAALEPLLTGNDDADLWAAVASTAASSGAAEATLQRLAQKPEGAPERQYNLLRARLALAAGDGAAAMAAAGAVKADDAELGAVLMARAAAAGAAVPGPLDIEVPAEALLIAAARPGRARAALKKATVTGWEALALRAEVEAKLDDQEGAAADWEAAMKAGGDAATEVIAPQLAAAATDPEQASALYKRAAQAALARYDGAAAGAATHAIVDLWTDALEPARALAETRDLDKDQPNSRYDYASVRVQIARAALAAGDAAAALAAARDASRGYADVGDAQGAAAAGWYHARAALLLSDDHETARAAAAAGPDSAAAGLHALLVGQPARALALLKDNQLSGVPGVHADLAAARAALSLAQDPTPYTSRAVSRADASGDLLARIESRLERHRMGMAAGDPRAVAGLSELRRIANELGDDGIPLQAEVAARSIMSGVSAQMPAAIGADAAAWDALSGGAIPEDSAHPVILWARARAQARAAHPERLLAAYSTATEATPVHHAGTWAPISVLDGRAGPGIETDLALLAKLPPEQSGMAALRIHEWYHAARAMEAAFTAGDDPSLSMNREERGALNGAFYALRAETLLWFAGGAERPSDAAQALEKLETAAMEVKGYARAIPAYTDDLSNLQEGLKSQAILSIRLGPTTGEMVVLTASDVKLQPLSNFKSIIQAAQQYKAALQASATHDHALVDPIPGDTIRAQVLDTVQQELQGIGRYLIIPDGPLWGFSMGALPEQRLGHRFMADIRTITVGVTVSSTFRVLPDRPQSFNPDFLGLSPREPTEEELRLKMPTEVENAGRLFGGGLRDVKVGQEATLAEFKKFAATTRYLHLSNVPTGERSALSLADKDLSLARVRDMDLVAQVVVISAESSPAAALRRIQAFESAGAGSVVVSTWLVDEQSRGKLFFAFYDSQNRDLTAARSLTEARQSLRGSKDADYYQPSWWGQYLLAGHP